nr:uncharacterized protein LOC111109932 isoform X2 [Crassostrea virginica]
MTHSQSSPTVYFLGQFSLNVTCIAPKASPGFGAIVHEFQICLNRSSSLIECSEPETVPDMDVKMDFEDLSMKLVVLMGQEICKSDSVFHPLKINRFYMNTATRDVTDARRDVTDARRDVTDARKDVTDVTDARRDVTDANGDVIDARQELQISNNEEDDLQNTVGRLRVGVALGTVLGFLGGVLTTGVIITVCTKKVLKQKIQRNSSQEIQTGEHGEPEEGKYDIVNYAYCDINSESYHRSTEHSSANRMYSGTSLHKYQDGNRNAYSHANHSILNAEYDHIQNECADEHLSSGEYKVLEFCGSEQEIGIVPTEKPNEDTNKTSENSYFELENIKSSNSDTGAYFVLQKEISGGDVGRKQF